MQRELYWLIESNGDLSATCAKLKSCYELMKTDVADLEKEDLKEIQYSITTVWYTHEEYLKLPDA